MEITIDKDAIIVALKQYDTPNQHRADFINKAAQDNGLLADGELYGELQHYLHNKLFDALPMSDDEIALLKLYPAIDASRAVKIAVTDELITKASNNPRALSAQETDALRVYFENAIIDEEPFNTTAYANISTHETAPVDMPSLFERSELDTIEYGYNIHDKDAIYRHLQALSESNRKLTSRETRRIKRLHGIDPKTDIIGF